MKHSNDRDERVIQGRDRDDADRGEASLRQLLESAGPRLPMPDEDLSAIKDAFRHAWREEVAGRPSARRWGRRNQLLALAASLLVGLGLVTWWLGGPPIGEPTVAVSFERIDGRVVLLASGGERPLTAADVPVHRALSIGTEISTEIAEDSGHASAAARVAFRMGSGPSIRLDHGSRIRVMAANVLRLERGAVYVDSVQEAADAAIEIRTAAGAVRHIGTQFEVRWLEADSGRLLRVRVREGMVEVDQNAVRHRLEAEEQLALDLATGAASRTRIDRDDPDWAWIQTVAPGFEIDRKSLGAFLAWAAREMGVTFVAADDPARAALADKLGGTVEHLAPAEAVAAVLMGAGLEYELEEGVLVVRAHPIRTTR